MNAKTLVRAGLLLASLVVTLDIALCVSGSARAESPSWPNWSTSDAGDYDGPAPAVADAASSDAVNDAPTSEGGEPTAMQGAFRAFHCGNQLVLCVDIDGKPLLDDEADARQEDVVPMPTKGDVVYIRVIGSPRDMAGQVLTIAVNGGVSPTRVEFRIPDGGTSDGGSGVVTRLIEATFTMPDAPSTTVHYRRAMLGSETSPIADVTFSLQLDRNAAFYFEAGLLVSFIPRGDRYPLAIPFAGTNDYRLHLHEDTRITAGIALNYFPWGIYGQGPWTRACTNPLPCLRHYLLEPVGVQLATTTDFSSNSFKEWYLGLAFEPIRGASLSFGAAFMRGQFFTPGYSEGMLLASSTLPPNATEFKFMVRPYLGVTISPEVLMTILSVFEQVKGLNKAQTQAP